MLTLVQRGVEEVAEGFSELKLWLAPFFILVPALLYFLGNESFPLALSPFSVIILVVSLYQGGAFSKETILDVVLFSWMIVSSCVVFFAVMATFGLGMVALVLILFGLSIFLTSTINELRRKWNSPNYVLKKHVTKKEKKKNLEKMRKEHDLTSPR